jgi:hypothetical protein
MVKQYQVVVGLCAPTTLTLAQIRDTIKGPTAKPAVEMRRLNSWFALPAMSVKSDLASAPLTLMRAEQPLLGDVADIRLRPELRGVG